ncbi:MAG: hypothetical protein HYV29_11690 [Ignavibacteriales bacterium]|nr:hypothetical protein [Ignavibacteriales bacterium]
MDTIESVIVAKKELPTNFVKTGWGLTVAGLILVGVSYATDVHRAAFNNVIGFAFLTSVAVGALFFVALEYIAGAVWSTPFRRVTEFLAALLPVTILLAVPLFMNMHDLFHWTHADVVAADEILKHKEPYLNTQFFMIRFAVVLGAWILFYYLFSRNSLKQDADKDQKHTRTNIKLAAVFIPFFAISCDHVSCRFSE